MRQDEHEGVLNDSEAARRSDKRDKRARQVLKHDVCELTEGGAFLRWFGRYAITYIMGVQSVNNGSVLAHFMGKRELILQMMADMEQESPGVLGRVLKARADYENELLKVEEQ